MRLKFKGFDPNEHVGELSSGAYVTNRPTALTIAFAIFPQVALSGELPVTWRGARSLGMGDSTTAVSNDPTAIFGNPAGVARLRNPRARWNLHVLSIPELSLGGSAAAVHGVSKSLTAPKRWFGNLGEVARENPGSEQTLEMQMFPVTVLGGKGTPTWLVGLPIRQEITAGVPLVQTEPGVTRARLVSNTTVTGAFAVGNTVHGGSIAYGVSFRPNVRYSSDLLIDQQALGFDVMKNAAVRDGKKTASVGVDAGVLLTAMDFWFPTLGVAVRNVPTGCVPQWLNPATGKTQQICGALRFGAVDATNAASQIDPTDVRVGVSLTPRFPLADLRLNIRLTADVHSIPVSAKGLRFGPADTPFHRLWNAGAEVFFGNALIQDGLAVRAGMHQNRPTYGFSFIAPGLSFEFASYQVQTNTASESARFDRRSLLGISSRW